VAEGIELLNQCAETVDFFEGEVRIVFEERLGATMAADRPTSC